jgi:choline dehydrogenase
MGSDNAAPIDTQLRVRGVEGLRVIDASVMPAVIAGNTFAMTILTAEKSIAFVLGARLKRRAYAVNAKIPANRVHP